MKLDEMEVKDFVMPKPKAPKYPHGLKIKLDSAMLEKLGVKGPLQIETKVKLLAAAEVVEVEKEEEGSSGDEAGFCVYLQIKELDLKKEGQDSNPSTTKVLYGE